MNASDAAEVAKLVSGAVWLFGRDREDNPRDGWDPESIARALSDVALTSVSLHDVKLAAAACWSDKDTERPGRLAENGPWWPRSGSRSPLQRSRDIREEGIPARDRARTEAIAKAAAAVALARNEPKEAEDAAIEQSVRLYESSWDHPDLHAEIRGKLAGHDLACFCPLDQPCHADVLLELANAARNEPQESNDE